MFSGIFTREYQKNTLLILVTKGLARWKIVAAKMCVLLVMWTVCYWMMFGITYGYNLYFWDHSEVKYVVFAAFCLYLMGIWLISLLILGSAFFNSSGAVLGIVGGSVFVCYLMSMISDISKYLPTYLMNSQMLLTGAVGRGEFTPVIVTGAIFSAVFVLLSVIGFNRKSL